ncbi:AraC family transcriptional regulator [Spirochaetia bacterium]|nr:AraC family transcriptional regulator [Spirochaetia bacterium]
MRVNMDDDAKKYFTRFEKDTDNYREPFNQKYPFDASFPFELLEGSYLKYPFHWHKYLEMRYILKGSVKASLNGSIYELHEGDIFIVNSGMIHGYFDCNYETYALTVLFGLDFFEQSLIDIRDPEYHNIIFNRKAKITNADDPVSCRKLWDIILSIYAEYSSKKDGYRIAIKRNMYDLALVFLRDIPPEQNPQSSKLNQNNTSLERVFSYLYKNYDNPKLTLEQAANNAYLSKFYFTRFFREKTGMTFHTYLSKYRINRAEEMLHETDDSITDIAYNCGFASLKTFNRLFKTYTGASPSEYRKGAKEGNI